MKILCTILMLMVSTSSFTQWESIGLQSQRIETICVSGSTIYVGLYFNGISVSSNGGATWFLSNSGLPDSCWVRTIISSGSKMFLGTEADGLYESTNNGISWTQIMNGIPTNINVRSLYTSGSTIFAGSTWFNGVGGGVYRSTNMGQSWNLINSGMPVPSSIFSLTSMGSYLFAGSRHDSGKVFKSTNNGDTWQFSGNGLLNNNNNEVLAFSVVGTRLFVACDNEDGIFVSSNFGVNWNPANNGLPAGNIEMRALTVYNSNLFAGGGDGVYLSRNNGANWTAKNEGLTDNYVKCMDRDNNYLYIGTNTTGVYRYLLSSIISIQNITTKIPEQYSLSQNYPNPFNPTTNIEFSLPEKSFVKLKVFDISGRQINDLVNENLSVGSYKVDFDGSNNSSGIYFYTLETDKFIETKRMVLLK